MARMKSWRGGCAALLLAWAISAANAGQPAATKPVASQPASTGPSLPPTWETAANFELKGLTVSVSRPRQVGRSKGDLHFPTLVRLANGDLLAIATDYPDENRRESTSLTSFSRDGGLTWSDLKAALYSDTHLRLPGGDELLLPYYLFPSGKGLAAPYQRVASNRPKIELLKDGVTVDGFPRPLGSLDAKLGLGGFVFNGQTVTLPKGGYLATLYGYFSDGVPNRYSLVAAESADGVHWKVRSVIADDKAKLKGVEGPDEAALCRLKDGRLLCVFRVGSAIRFCESFSSDEGATWTSPEEITAYSVQPSLAVMQDGLIVLTAGRPGVKAWFNLDGSGKTWQAIDLASVHQRYEPESSIAGSTAYTEVVALDASHLLCIYDCGKNQKADDMNSVWVVRIEVTRK